MFPVYSVLYYRHVIPSLDALVVQLNPLDFVREMSNLYNWSSLSARHRVFVFCSGFVKNWKGKWFNWFSLGIIPNVCIAYSQSILILVHWLNQDLYIHLYTHCYQVQKRSSTVQKTLLTPVQYHMCMCDFFGLKGHGSKADQCWSSNHNV